jgi:tetratricopeptide (TPR) repeat protein
VIELGAKNMRLLFGIFLLAVRSGQASDTQKRWSDWFSEGQSFRNTGNYSAAAHAFREALAVAERSAIDDRRLVELHDALAGSYADAGQFAESAHQYRNALDLVAKVEGGQSLDYAVLLGELTLLPAGGGESQETVALLRSAILNHRLDGSPKNLSSVRSSLVQILLKKRLYQEADQVLLDLRTDLAKQKPANPQLLAAALMESGVLRFNQLRYGEAIDFYLESLRLQEIASGTQHPALVRPMNNLATAYTKMGRFNEACSLYQRALLLCGKTLGEDHQVYGVLLQNYAFVLRKLGHKREAKGIDAQSRRIEQTSVRRNGSHSTISVISLRSSAK